MTKHLADKRKPSNGGRLKQFLRIAHEDSSGFWKSLQQRPVPQPVVNRRAVEFVRIDRGRDA
jgi:hypothetical protein